MMFSKKNLLFFFFFMFPVCCFPMDDQKRSVFNYYAEEFKKSRRCSPEFCVNMRNRYQSAVVPTRGMEGENNHQKVIYEYLEGIRDSLSKGDEKGFGVLIGQMVNYAIGFVNTSSDEDFEFNIQGVKAYMSSLKKYGIPSVSWLKRKGLSVLANYFGSGTISIGGLVGGSTAIQSWVSEDWASVVTAVLVFFVSELNKQTREGAGKLRDKVHTNNDMFVRMKQEVGRQLKRFKNSIVQRDKNGIVATPLGRPWSGQGNGDIEMGSHTLVIEEPSENDERVVDEEEGESESDEMEDED